MVQLVGVQLKMLLLVVYRMHVVHGRAAAGVGVGVGAAVAGVVHLELVHRLLVLAQVVEPGELFEAEVTLKGSFAGVFADVSGQMLRPGEDHRAARVACALEKLALGLFRHAVAGCCWCR